MLLVCMAQMQMQMLCTMQQEHGDLRTFQALFGPALGSQPTHYDLSDMQIDRNRTCPTLDAFFEELKITSPWRKLGSMLAKLTDAGVHAINELVFWMTTELVDSLQFTVGDARWLMAEVKVVLGSV